THPVLHWSETMAEHEALGNRLKRFALRVINLYSALPRTKVAQVLGQQMLRSGTSAGAHYREANRARSNAEFISKIEGGLQELDETAYWFELLVESKTISASRLSLLAAEANELIAICVTMVKKTKNRRSGE